MAGLKSLIFYLLGDDIELIVQIIGFKPPSSEGKPLQCDI